jgi:nucleoside-diphosphate-sugar epimerase
MWNILLHGESSTYNVGGNSQTTIKELAEIIARDLNVKVSLPKEVNTLPGSPDNVYLDMTKVKKEFKKITFKPLAEGIKNTIEWQKILYSTN